MKQEINSQIISNGIDNSLVGAWLKAFIYLGMFIGIILVIYIISTIFINHTIVSNAPASREIKCNYPILQCSISDHTKLLGGEVVCPNKNPNEACYQTANYFPILDTNNYICGWQEANAYFQYYKLNTPRLDNSNLSITCTQ